MTNINDKTNVSLKLTISLIVAAISITCFLLNIQSGVKENNLLIVGLRSDFEELKDTILDNKQAIRR